MVAARLPGPMTELSQEIGTIIDGKYRIDELIGMGMMGMVYRATHLPDGLVVAIKFMTDVLLMDNDISVARFNREARVIGKLKHPNILRLHGYGQNNRQPYLAMQYVKGGDLHGLLGKEQIALEQVARMLDQMASGLDYAHSQQVIHRDIKPANILLDENRNAILADFGLARMDEAGGGQLTGAGILVGTPAYMAPELAGEGRLTPSVDLYALACILYQMLTNQLPFQSETTVGYLMQHLGAERPDVRSVRGDLPQGLTYVLRRALARDIVDRYPTGAALARAFREAMVEKSADELAIATLALEVPELIQSPFKGLEAFEEADAPYFYGREAIVQQLLERLQTPDVRFLAVLGASGSGKSSLVRAGLIPALRKDALPGSSGWPILIFTPGAQPLRALANSLQVLTGIAAGEMASQIEQEPEKLSIYVRLLTSRQGDRSTARLVLFVDQFEEAFTRASEVTRDAFLAALIHAATGQDGRTIIILTMRADFYHRVAGYRDPRLAQLFQEQQVIARAMTPAELRHAIEAPAQVAGLEYEGGLIETVLADVAQEPGSLPLLQYALQELFRDKRGFGMTRQSYEMTGGVQGALARRAEAVFNQLDRPQQVLMRRILLRLVEVNEAGEITRRRVNRDQLVFDNTPDEVVEDILDRLTNPEVRLLTANREWQTGAQWIDVSHEALIQRWERLQLWVRENLSSLLLGGQLLKTAQDWRKFNQDNAYLLRGVRLDEALRWLASSDADVLPVERELIAASVSAREGEEAALEAQRQREFNLERDRATQAERAQRQLRVMLIGAVLFTILAIGLAAAAIYLANAAQTARGVAERRASEVQSLALAQSAQQAAADHNSDLALALGLQSVGIEQPPVQAQQSLAEVVDSVNTIRQFNGHSDFATSVAFSSDGKTALSGSFDNTLILWDVATGKAIRTFTGHTDHVSSVAFSPDGKTAASGSWDGSVRLWNLATGKEIRRFTGHSAAVTSTVYNPDGLTLLSASWDKTLILWDVVTGQHLRTLTGHTDRVSSVALSPDGRLAISGSWDGTLILWDVAKSQLIRKFSNPQKINSVAFSPDGKSVLSGGEDRIMHLWNLVSGKEIQHFGGHTDQIRAVGFSPDGGIVASASADKSIRLWSVETGREIRRLDGHTAEVWSLAYSKDSRTLLSASADNSVRLWDVEIRRFSGHALSVSSIVFSPDGKMALSGSADKTLIIWDVVTGGILHRLEGHTDVVENAVFSPDGKMVLSAADDSLVILWDVATGKEIRRFTGHTDWVANVVFSRDGKTAFSSSGSPDKDKSMILWDVATGKEIRRFEGHTDTVVGLSVSADGKTILSGSWDQTMILWDVATGSIIRKFTGHKDKVWAVGLSPDGKTALSASTDRTIRLWDVATGKELLRLDGHTGSVNGAVFSPDGNTILSASDDHTVRLWDVATGKELRRFEGHMDKVWNIAFSPDGQLALSASADKTVRVWRISRTLGDLVQWIHDNRYVRDLTCDEREQFRVEPLCAANSVVQAGAPGVAITATPVVGHEAHQGINRGKIEIGGGELWTYKAQAGEAILIQVNADKPANESTDAERITRGLFDARISVRGLDGAFVREADDTVGENFRTTDPLIERLEFPAAGIYQIEVRSFGNESGGAYTLVIGTAKPTPTVQATSEAPGAAAPAAATQPATK